MDLYTIFIVRMLLYNIFRYRNPNHNLQLNTAVFEPWYLEGRGCINAFLLKRKEKSEINDRKCIECTDYFLLRVFSEHDPENIRLFRPNTLI